MLTSACSCGGIKLISASNRITIDNTLDERMRLLEDRVRSLPVTPISKAQYSTARCSLRFARTSLVQTRTASSTTRNVDPACSRLRIEYFSYDCTYLPVTTSLAQCQIMTNSFDS